MSKEIRCTREEALREINKRRGLKRAGGYQVFTRPFLPVGDDGRGYEGCALVSVTKKEFIRAIESSLRNLEERGARITLMVPTEEYEAYIIG